MAAVPHLSFPSEYAIPDLGALLHRVFGHREFRPHQQPVCEAAAAGRDVLLVMPTGAGKSLCYQLPALARQGTALVISPLIALMDDQAQKLSSLNLRVARIHSGLPREALREAARAYLEGRLDFLFIAPERLRVPGFPEMLARRKPALVAIDEAHCISQWGHDFRPDYRTLGQFLPALRPSPIIALTATATPTVQQDILRALNLTDPAVFITGFRRTNLHIEIVEASRPERPALMRKLLAPDSARPAIVYAQSRKAADEIASTLGAHFPTAPYHAGLDPSTRDRVQRAFLSGKLDVVVATVAFGMGVDKADVRTVLHAALPGSVEAYYQEIGRAGRDGQPSRVVLLHNFADRRTQEFLLEKNYPPVPDVERVLTAIQSAPRTLDALQQQLKSDRGTPLERETIEQCVDKLLIQGAVTADLDGNVLAAAASNWKQNYEQQVGYRRTQIDKIIAYAEGVTCRMAALIHHFGDRTDSGKPCGCCDICRPEGAATSETHPATPTERLDLRAILKALQAGPRSAGKVFADLAWKDRKHFDHLSDALARAGLLAIVSDSFRTEDGRDISYRKLSLTVEGQDVDDAALATVWLRTNAGATANPGRPSSARNKRPERQTDAADPLSGVQAELESRLKAWRLALARQHGIPPFTIFHDSVLRSIAQAQPASVAQLEAVRGIGQEKSYRYSADLLALCRGEEISPTHTPTPRPEPKAAQPKTRQGSPSPPSPGQQAAETGQTSFLTERERSLVRGPVKPRIPSPPNVPDRPLTGTEQELDARLRQWRSEQATAAGLPSFFVLSDTALKQVILAQPRSLEELGTINGLGPDKVDRYGAALLTLCAARG